MVYHSPQVRNAAAVYRVTPNTVWLWEWIRRMQTRYGHSVYGDGRVYDWGQALARECHGPGWSQRADVPDAPTDADLERAARWEAGEWPAWVDGTSDVDAFAAVRAELQDRGEWPEDPAPCAMCDGAGEGAECELMCDDVNFGDDVIACPGCRGTGLAAVSGSA